MKEQNIKTKEIKGITLIALVVTIIVLLILAAVSIAILTGDNGILNQADRAGEETEKVEVIEKAKTDILGLQAKNKSGEITIGQLKDVLGKYFKDVSGEEELKEKLKEKDFKLTSKLEYGEQEVEISEIYKGSSTERIASKVNALIGQTVNYEEDSGKVDAWRIFYASEDEMFLISQNTVNSYAAFGGGKGIPLAPRGKYSETESGNDYSYSNESDKYTGSGDVFSLKTGKGEGYSYSNVEYGKTYNKLWYDIITGEAEDDSDTDVRNNSIATAYLCDPANWTEYIGINAPDGTYAVGGPTKELLVRSWVASGQTKGTEETLLEDTEVSAYGYKTNKPDVLYGSIDSRPIQNSILNGLYNNGTTYKLASPSNYSNYTVCSVSNDGYVTHSDYFYANYGVRPLVSIPLSKVKIGENGEVSIVDN